MTSKNPIAAAIELLTDSADELRHGISINGVPDWEGEPDTKTLYNEHLAVVAGLRELAAVGCAQSQDSEVWSRYVASMVEGYLQSEPAADKREAAIAGIIGRRLWALSSGPDRVHRQAEPSMTVAFDDGAKEPRIVSWNKHPAGMYWLYSAPQPAQVPEGFKLVPLEPNLEMLSIFAQFPVHWCSRAKQDSQREAYSAMLEAALCPQ